MDLIKIVLENKKLPDRAFLKKCGVRYDMLSEDIISMFIQAIADKSSDDIEACLYIVFRFKCYSVSVAELINSIIMEDWHQSHEDMASYLQKLRLPSSVEPLYYVSKKKYQYLEYDDSLSLASKCIWALGAIGNGDAIDKLIQLSNDKDETIAEYAREQLIRKGIE